MEKPSHIGKNGLEQLDALIGKLLASDSLLKDLSVLEEHDNRSTVERARSSRSGRSSRRISPDKRRSLKTGDHRP